MNAIEELFLRGPALNAFTSGDRVTVRDPAGIFAGARLRVGVRRGEEGLVARGPFLLHIRWSVAKAEGIRFCRATGDDNEIHSVGDVVPGAMTAAKALLPIEVIFPEIEVVSIEAKFTAVASYGRSLFTTFRVEPTAEGAAIRVRTFQEGAPIADMELAARRCDPLPRTEIARRKVSVERLRAVRSFIQSLHLSPHAFFRRPSVMGYHYPKAFLASLPSGAMVRHFRGDGGLLNKLTLEFDPGVRVPIVAGESPAVAVEEPKKQRPTFNKILTAIGDSIRTYVRGTALVLKQSAAAERAVS